MIREKVEDFIISERAESILLTLFFFWCVITFPFFIFVTVEAAQTSLLGVLLFGPLAPMTAAMFWGVFEDRIKTWRRGEYAFKFQSPIKVTRKKQPLVWAEPCEGELWGIWLQYFESQHANYVRTIRHIERGRYVYVIRDATVTGFCKIGKTVEPSRRLNRFMVKLPFRVQIIFVIKVENHHQFETKLHHMFASKHVDGEWFSLDFEDLTKIGKMAGVETPQPSTNGHH